MFRSTTDLHSRFDAWACLEFKSSSSSGSLKGPRPRKELSIATRKRTSVTHCDLHGCPCCLLPFPSNKLTSVCFPVPCNRGNSYILVALLNRATGPRQSSFFGKKSLASSGLSGCDPRAFFASTSIWCLPVRVRLLSSENTIFIESPMTMNRTAIMRCMSSTIHRSGPGRLASSVRPELPRKIWLVFDSGVRRGLLELDMAASGSLV